MKRLRGDDGAVTVWTMGGVLLLLLVGGLALGLYEAFSVRRAYTSAADAAAQAGANALDVDLYRATNERQLVAGRAEALAWDSLESAELPDVTSIDVEATATEVVVSITGEVDLGLLGLVDDDPLEVSVRAVGGA